MAYHMDRYDSFSNHCSKKLKLAYQTKEKCGVIYNSDDQILSKKLMSIIYQFFQ